MEKLWFQVINRDGTPQTIRDAEGNEKPITVGAESEAHVEEYRKKGWREMPVAVKQATETKAPEGGEGGEKTQTPEGNIAGCITEGEDSAFDGAGEGRPENIEEAAPVTDAASEPHQAGLLDAPAAPKNITGSKGGKKR